MIDHIGIAVSDYQAAVQFYQKVLAPLDYELLIEVAGFAGLGKKNTGGAIANFWLRQDNKPTGAIHIAFTASSREQVDAFYQAAIAAGGKDNGKPGVREIYHPNYYGAFILDLDGHNIEAVCHH
ncbi:MAG: glyoxalase/bleomycin resistance/extradiol dioxygenase family protein [Legionellales bacterium]|nr:glyoxalase/bleomycin resistance/extradiol dioxygenase family protein [Legionellales bacterium]